MILDVLVRKYESLNAINTRLFFVTLDSRKKRKKMKTK